MDKRIEASKQWAREYFLENPGASVDTAAREMEKVCAKTLHKDELSRIRMEVRQTIESSHSTPSLQKYAPKPLPGARGPIVRKKRVTSTFANHPRIHIPQRDPEAKLTVAEAAAQAEAVVTPTAPPPSTTEAVSSTISIPAGYSKETRSKLDAFQKDEKWLLRLYLAMSRIYGSRRFSFKDVNEALGLHDSTRQRDVISSLAAKYRLLKQHEKESGHAPVTWSVVEVLTEPPAGVDVVAQVQTEWRVYEEAKTRWLYAFCEKHLEMNLHQVNEAVIAEWGTGFFIPKVSEAMKLARKYAGMPEETPFTSRSKKSHKTPTKTVEEIPTGAEVLQLQKEKALRDSESKLKALEHAAKALARQMKLTSTKEVIIQIDDEGGVDFRFKRVEITTDGGKLDLDTE